MNLVPHVISKADPITYHLWNCMFQQFSTKANHCTWVVLECKTQAWKGQHSFIISAHWDKHVIPCRSGVVISMANTLPVTDYRVAGVRRRPNLQNGSKLIPFLYQLRVTSQGGQSLDTGSIEFWMDYPEKSAHQGGRCDHIFKPTRHLCTGCLRLPSGRLEWSWNLQTIVSSLWHYIRIYPEVKLN